MNESIGGSGRGGEGIIPPESSEPMAVHIAARSAFLEEMAWLKISGTPQDTCMERLEPFAGAVVNSFWRASDVNPGQTPSEVIDIVADLLSTLEGNLRDPFYRLVDEKVDPPERKDAVAISEELKSIFDKKHNMLAVKRKILALATKSILVNIGPVFGKPKR